MISTVLTMSTILVVGISCDALADRIKDQFDKNSKTLKIINNTVYCGLVYFGYKILSDVRKEK